MTTDTISDVPAKAPLLDSLRKLLRQDSGLVPVLAALVLLVIYFEIRSSVFLQAANIANLFTQAAVYVLLAMAETWLLLLGEIDLSLGWASTGAGMLAGIYTNVQYGWPWPLAFILGLLAAVLVALVSGFLTVKFRVASFIVTLGMQLVIQGLVIYELDKVFQGGGVPVQDAVLRNLIAGDLTPVWSWVFVVAVIVGLSAITVWKGIRRRSAGLESVAFWKVALRIAVIALVGVFLGFIFSVNRGSFVPVSGIPFAVPIVFLLVGFYSFLLGRTKFGRYMYAIGGNAEAARRAGVPVDRYRIYAFMLGGLTAGIAGLMLISQLGGIASSSTDPSIVLYAVAGAVIGGVSLFGGRGRMVGAVLGGVILAVIKNGLTLIQLSGPAQYIVTGVVLIAAVLVDVLGRRSQQLAK
ncbi:MAG: ABC transporter permease [Acidimicrobiaceae bacterium]|nr:ABC transporter permease [Acidimicrobiaceae bacterium]